MSPIIGGPFTSMFARFGALVNTKLDFHLGCDTLAPKGLLCTELLLGNDPWGAAEQRLSLSLSVRESTALI